MAGESSRPDNAAILKHLVSGCSECSAITSRLWEERVTGRHAPRAPTEQYEAAFDRAWFRATQIKETLRLEHQAAEELIAEFLDISPTQQFLRIRNDPRYQSLPLARLLCERSKSAIFDHASTAAHLAQLAREIIENIDESRYGAAIVADARADALATYANAARENSDFEDAEFALRAARKYLDEGTGDPAEKANYLGSLSNLLIGRGRLDEALTSLRELEAIYVRLGDRHMLGRVQLKRAFALHKMGAFDAEIQVLHRALELLDPARDPQRQVVVLHNLVVALIDADRCDEAVKYLEPLRQRHQEQGDRLNLVRFRWLEARLAYGRNDLDTAVSLFSEVRSRFIELEIGFDVALASLDLAEVLWLQGRADETQARLLEAIPILEALGVHAEALAAMAFLQEAVRVETVSRTLIRETAAFLRRLQTDPSVRFSSADLSLG